MGSELETPKYELIDKDRQFEIRMYEPMIKYQKRLEKMLIKKQHIIDGDFMVAQYNSPWILPPFRRNEIMVRIK